MPDKGQEHWQFNDIPVDSPETGGLQFNNVLVTGPESRGVQLNDMLVI
jgi:hypothetical protein